MSKLEETFDAESIAYVKDILADMAANPDIHPGMHVKMVHITMDGDEIFRGFGVITRVYWSDFYSQNMCDLQLTDGPPVYGVMRCQVERVSFGGKEHGRWLKGRVVK